MSESGSFSNPDLPQCSVCQSSNTEISQCQNCFLDTCTDCVVPSVWIFSHAEGKGQYPVCLICDSYISKLELFLVTEKIKWCEMTPRGEKWFSASTAKAWARSQIGIDSYMDVNVSPVDLEMIEKDVDTGRSDPSTHNWEVREILCRVVGDSYKQDIKKVLSAYCVKNNKVGYCQGMNIVTVWLLMFFDHNTAFFMLCFLIEKLLLPDFYIGGKHGNSLNGFYIESTVIAGLLEYLLPAIQTSAVPSNEFSDFFSLQHLIQIFVSTVDIETTVFLWDMLCEQGSIALIRGIVSLIIISEKAVVQGTHPLHILKLLNENRIAPQVKETYIRLTPEINSLRVEKLRKLAKDYRAKQWLKCEKLTLHKLETVSNFTKEEIQSLQVEFNLLMKNKKKDVGPLQIRKRRSTVQLPQALQQKMTDYQGSNNIGVSKPEFMQMISSLLPNHAGNSSDLFDKFDEDASGYLDFRELTIAMSILSNGDFEEKLRICFDAYDSDHSGYLQMVEIQLLIEKMLRPYADAIEMNPESKEIKETIVNVHQKMVQLSEKFNGKLAFHDFLNGIKADMFLYNCICEYIGTGKTEVKRIVSAINSGTITEEPHGHNGCNMCRIC